MSFFVVHASLIFFVYQSPFDVLKMNIPKRNTHFSGFTHSRLAEADTTSHLDMLFIGSSLVYRGYDTRIYEKAGLRVFNLGTSAQLPSMSYILAQKYVPRMKPKLVVIDVNPKLLTLEKSKATADLIWNQPTLDRSSISLLLQSHDIYTFHVFMLRLLGVSADAVDKTVDDRYVRGGFVPSFVRDKKSISDAYQNVQYSELQVTSLKKLIAFLKEENCKVVLVQSPINREAIESLMDIDFDEAFFRGLAPYYNVNHDLQLSKENFKDYSHLNYWGAQKFGAHMLPLLQKLAKE